METTETTTPSKITIPETGTQIVYASYPNDTRHIFSDFSTPWTTSECGWAKKARTPVIMNGHSWTEADRKSDRMCKKCAKGAK